MTRDYIRDTAAHHITSHHITGISPISNVENIFNSSTDYNECYSDDIEKEQEFFAHSSHSLIVFTLEMKFDPFEEVSWCQY